MNVAFIPVRGGSKSIPLKNIKPLCGKPLVYWTIKAACNCEQIDKVFVSTDSEEIWNIVESFKAEGDNTIQKKLILVKRSSITASDTASTESAMLEFAKSFEFDNIVLIQATSPLLRTSDLTKGFEVFNEYNTDSVLSVVVQKRFQWSIDENGNAFPSNYDVFKRPRRQDFEGYYVENGAFYITSKLRLEKSKNRVSGNIKIVEMDEDSFFEIDEPSDWIIIEALMKKNINQLKMPLSQIKLFLTDCDGCLTDGGMYYSEKGDELKKFNTRDGMGFKILQDHGILTGIITSENVALNRKRADKLKLDIFIDKCTNKAIAIENICKQYNIKLENVLYIGDDINDLEIIQKVGFGCCPADAVKIIKENAKYITKAQGGQGAIREIVDYILS